MVRTVGAGGTRRAVRAGGVVDRQHPRRQGRRVARGGPRRHGQHPLPLGRVARHVRRHRRRGPPADRVAPRRGTRAGRRRRLPAAELARSDRVVRRSGDGRLRARADRAHLRPQGGRASSSPSAAPTPTSRPPRTATSTTRRSSTRRLLAGLRVHVVVGDGADQPAPDGIRRVGWDSLDLVRPGHRPADAACRRGGGARVHVGHDQRPEGRDPRPPHHAERAAAHERMGRRKGRT